MSVEPETLIREIGHDGLEVWWPKQPKPYCYRGHHPQELQECAIRRLSYFGRYELMPTIAPHTQPQSWRPLYDDYILMLGRFWNLIDKMAGCRAILIGGYKNSEYADHAVAWSPENAQKIYDPNGMKNPTIDFQIKEAWIYRRVVKCPS